MRKYKAVGSRQSGGYLVYYRQSSIDGGNEIDSETHREDATAISTWEFGPCHLRPSKYLAKRMARYSRIGAGIENR